MLRQRRDLAIALGTVNVLQHSQPPSHSCSLLASLKIGKAVLIEEIEGNELNRPVLLLYSVSQMSTHGPHLLFFLYSLS